ncbi:MAG: T9SS type A sorting domain-containing protein [Bacteroidia bacterium]|nr:T9SS type A sorting domain-containing protein [Bacteroidia bacterium]
MKKLIFIFGIFAFTIFGGKSQPNGGFENWSTILNSQSPDGWQTLNFLGFFTPPNPTSSFKVSGVDKHSGNYALKIKTIFVNNNPAPGGIDDTVGLVFTGKINLSPPSYKYGFPYVGRPEKLEFWSKYIPVGNDTGGVRIFLRKWNGTGNDTIGFGEMVITTTIAYSLFKVDLTYISSEIPDSASIVFGSSEDADNARVGSALYVDDVAFTGWVGINQYDLYANKVQLFPNPAKDELNIFAEIDNASDVKVIDALGKFIGIYKIQNNKVLINTSMFTSGIYFYDICDKNDKTLTKGKFNIIR